MFRNSKFKIKHSPRGVSLPLVTGLLTLLMIASMATNELIIRSIRSVRSIEASNRAYFAAEGGVEDALYEVSPHWAGYQTPALDNPDARRSYLDTKGDLAECGEIEKGGRWANCWAVESRSGSDEWNEKMFKGQKMILSLYVDKNENTVGANGVNPNSAEISNLKPNNFSIKFSIPEGSTASTDITTIMDKTGHLIVDTDRDGDWNEDGPGAGTDRSNINCKVNPADADCDGKVDEDSDEDPIILWKLTDNTGRSLIPLKGCLEPPSSGSEICEKDFNPVFPGNTHPDDWSVILDSNSSGENQDGDIQTIGNFITGLDSGPKDQIQFEFLIVAPMEFVNPANTTQRVPIPYIEYEIISDNPNIPYPYFKINSDGYYGTYKQSITTTLTPKTTVPLFDFTIIQQQ